MKFQLSDKFSFSLSIFVCVVVAAVAVLLNYLALKSTNQTVSEASSIVEVSPLPSQSDKPMPLVWAVWNGSGKTGEAGKLANIIKQAGYEVVEIKNAPQLYKQTQVQVKQEFAGEMTQVRPFVNVAKLQTDLDSSAKYDIKVIIGENGIN